MKALFLCLTLAVFPGFGGQPGGSAPIALFAQFEHQPPAAVVDALHEEVNAIMQPAGLRFEWRSLDREGRSRPAVELAVVTFKGRCDPVGWATTHIQSGALGWTHVSDGVILPFSEVDCERIHGFLQRVLSSFPAADRPEIFGRALARVLAHELYHIFADTERHGSCGVAKSAYTVHELVSDDFEFEARERDALRTSKAHERLEASADER